MDDNDKEYLEALYKGFAMLCYALSDAMMEARNKREPEEGIVKIKRVRKT